MSIHQKKYPEGTLVLTGASDDLIEIAGDIDEEFNKSWSDRRDEDNTGGVLACSDGTLLRIVYDRDGIWRITQITRGRSAFAKVDGVVDDDTFDVVTLTLPPGERFEWIVLGEQRARRGA